MASKKTTTRKSEAKPETKAKAATPAPPMADVKSPAKKAVWTLPVALLMLVVASGALWMAVRESSNTSQAATPAATNAVMAPDGTARTAAKPAAASAASTVGTTGSKDAAKASETSSAIVSKPVSITGCLKRADEGFVLKNTEGVDAPKSRSWKSGFFKRSSATVSLNDTGNLAHLADHVNQKVTVTGPLTDREMRVTSLRRTAATCE